MSSGKRDVLEHIEIAIARAPRGEARHWLGEAANEIRRLRRGRGRRAVMRVTFTPEQVEVLRRLWAKAPIVSSDPTPTADRTHVNEFPDGPYEEPDGRS